MVLDDPESKWRVLGKSIVFSHIYEYFHDWNNNSDMSLKEIGDYRFGKTIGAGAFSKVKIATYMPTRQKVAIKIIDKVMMKQKFDRSRIIKQERQRQIIIERQKKAYYENQRKKVEVPEDNLITDSGDALDFTQLIDDMSLRKAKIEIVQILAEPQPQVTNYNKKEILLLMRLEHPNIIKIYEMIESETEELAQGGELMNFITANGRLSEKETRRLFRQIVSGLHHIHQANVVHRDLKLENLLLDQNRNVLISDFGLGRTFEPDQEASMQTFCGTPNYAAIELILGTPYNGIKADIWSLGVILYTLVAGNRPFIGQTLGLLYKKIVNLEYVRPTYFSPELLDLIGKVFVKDQKSRINMEGICNHPWVTMDEGPPANIPPRFEGSITEATLARNISSITSDKKYTIYTFNSFQKFRTGGLPSIADQKVPSPARLRGRSVSACQSNSLPIVKSKLVEESSSITHPPLHRLRRFSVQNELVKPHERCRRKSSDIGFPQGMWGRRRSSDRGFISILKKSTSRSNENNQYPSGSFDQTQSANYSTKRSSSIIVTNDEDLVTELSVDLEKNNNIEVMAPIIEISGNKEINLNIKDNQKSAKDIKVEKQNRDESLLRRMSTIGSVIEKNLNDVRNVNASIPFDTDPTQQELDLWHATHKPPSTIRSMRFSFGTKTCSNLDPATMFQDVHKALVTISQLSNTILQFKRQPDFYIFHCNYRSQEIDPMTFELEICKVAMLKIHALRVKRIQGDQFEFQNLYNNIVDNINWKK